MATITDRLPNTDKFFISPVYGKQTQIDEMRFVEDYLARPKETLDKYGIRYELNKMVYTFLFKYGFWKLGLRNYGCSYESDTMYLSDWVFETVKEKAKQCGLSERDIRSHFGSSKIDDTYATSCCYGRLGQRGTLFSNIPYNIRSTCLSDYEYFRAMKPFQISTIHIYKDEVDTILNVFDDYRYIIVALHMIMRAKHFQANRLMFDDIEMVVRADRGSESLKINEGNYWYTPCIKESSWLRTHSWYWYGFGEEPSIKKERTHSRYFKHELGVDWKYANGTDRKSVITIYNEVMDKMLELGLFTTSEDVMGLRGYGNIEKYVTGDKARRICMARINATHQHSNVYRPTFLTLEKDETPVITITYEDYENGYIYNFLEYLCEIGHESVKPFNKCKIVKCKECGKRFGVLYDGKSKGRTPTTCATCGSGKAKTARSRKKGAIE